MALHTETREPQQPKRPHPPPPTRKHYSAYLLSLYDTPLPSLASDKALGCIVDDAGTEHHQNSKTWGEHLNLPVPQGTITPGVTHASYNFQ